MKLAHVEAEAYIYVKPIVYCLSRRVVLLTVELFIMDIESYAIWEPAAH